MKSDMISYQEQSDDNKQQTERWRMIWPVIKTIVMIINNKQGVKNNMISYHDQVMIINNKQGIGQWYDQLSGPSDDNKQQTGHWRMI